MGILRNSFGLLFLLGTGITAAKPFECLASLNEPIVIAGGSMSLETGANHGMGLDRLLVVRRCLLTALPKAVGTNRAEMAIRRDLVFRVR